MDEQAQPIPSDSADQTFCVVGFKDCFGVKYLDWTKSGELSIGKYIAALIEELFSIYSKIALLNEPFQQDYTARLPNELLNKIFEYLMPWSLRERKAASALMLVSWRWRSLFERVYYRRLYVRKDQKVQLRRLIQTFQTRPELRNCVRHVPVPMMFASGLRTSRLVSELLRLCPQARCIKLCLDLKPDMPFLDVIPQFCHLERLALASHFCGPSLTTVAKLMELPTLKELKLHRYTARRHTRPDTEQPGDISAMSTSLEQISLFARSHGSSVTKLELADPLCSPYITIMIASWPARLTTFNFTSIQGSNYNRQYATASIQQILDTQSSSLQHIKLGMFGAYGNNSLPEFAHFTALKSLQVSSYNICGQDPRIVILRKLASTSLDSVCISSSIENQFMMRNAFMLRNTEDRVSEEVWWLKVFAAGNPMRLQEGLKELQVRFVRES